MNAFQTGYVLIRAGSPGLKLREGKTSVEKERMAYMGSRGGDFYAIFVSLLVLRIAGGNAQLVPAIILFGDSSVDVGNNNYLPTLFRSDFLPYGRDFVTKSPTGRFCNGKLATDITAENLGFDEYPRAYLSPEASGKNLLIGANFGSAGSGYYDATALTLNAIPLSQQLEYYKEYQSRLERVARENTSSIITEALYIVSTGSTDFVQNYYVNPLINKVYTPEEFSSFLVSIFCGFIRDLHKLGARRIGVTALPPIGCVPAVITLFGGGSNDCVERFNIDAQNFNKKLIAAADSLGKSLPNLKIAVFDIYKPTLDLIEKPSDFGFFESRKGCCGTGTVETSVLCNPKSPGTCRNATGYVFFDSVHPTESANQVLSDSLISQGIDLVS
ncbi:GDSL esterase/lipase APG-like [Wolffia australiana]